MKNGIIIDGKAYELQDVGQDPCDACIFAEQCKSIGHAVCVVLHDAELNQAYKLEKNKIKIEIDADFECNLIDMNVFEDGEEITDFSLGNLVSLYTVVLAVKKKSKMRRNLIMESESTGRWTKIFYNNGKEQNQD